jgi:ATP phosphoribosyltransferase regulatory subunit
MSAPPIAPPRGFRDILPLEAHELAVIESVLAETFESAGFVPLHPPLLEHGAIDPDHRRVQFIDSDGRLIALRPDLTTSVARLVAGRYGTVAGQLRLSYIAPVYRQEPSHTAGAREILQAGVELVGTSDTLTDAEILALLAEAIERCGLCVGESTIHVGDVRLVEALFASLGAPDRARVLACLRAGDVVGALATARDAGMTRAELESARDALARAGETPVDCAGELGRTLDLARECWPGRQVRWGSVNLGVIPAFPYYTGIVFEAVHPDAGIIASGGRYDLLLGAYGAPRPAIGFAIDVLQLHRALVAGGWSPNGRGPLLLLRASRDERATMRCLRAFRSAGFAVSLDEIAETAGRNAIRGEVLDEERIRLADGTITDAAGLRARRGG